MKPILEIKETHPSKKVQHKVAAVVNEGNDRSFIEYDLNCLMKRGQNHVIFNNSHHNYIIWDKEPDVLYMIKKRRVVSRKRSKMGTKHRVTTYVTNQGNRSWIIRQKGILEE